MSERPVHPRPRRLADWINPTGKRKVHSLIDKVYKRKNLEIAWERVKANRGSGGVDGESVEQFGERLNEHLDQLHDELRTDQYRPRPCSSRLLPRADHLPRAASPAHSGRRSSGRVAFAALRVLPARPTTRRVSLPVSLALMGLLFSVPPKNAASSPGVTC